MKPIRVQLSRKKGWKMPDNTVKVDRSSPWGNPFRVERWIGQGDIWMINLGGAVRSFSTKAEAQAGAVELFKERAKCVEYLRRSPQALRGKNLACWCKPGTSCHADVLLKIANS